MAWMKKRSFTLSSVILLTANHVGGPFFSVFMC